MLGVVVFVPCRVIPYHVTSRQIFRALIPGRGAIKPARTGAEKIKCSRLKKDKAGLSVLWRWSFVTKVNYVNFTGTFEVSVHEINGVVYIGMVWLVTPLALVTAWQRFDRARGRRYFQQNVSLVSCA